jgi:tRNA 2-thiouridine synthesizing protein E
MRYFEHNNKKYRVDANGYLLYPEDWDEDYAIGMAEQHKIPGGLTDRHWKVIYFIRNNFEKINVCPLIYVACKNNHLGLGDLKKLFPRGYMRGACKLAGITYRAGQQQVDWIEGNITFHRKEYENKTYEVDDLGFLKDSKTWDENFALHRAHELNMPDSLTQRHWEIIYYLRNKFFDGGEIPNVYDTCEANNLSIQELEQLFPTGYHRGAVNIAGLRAL